MKSLCPNDGLLYLGLFKCQVDVNGRMCNGTYSRFEHEMIQIVQTMHTSHHSSKPALWLWTICKSRHFTISLCQLISNIYIQVTLYLPSDIGVVTWVNVCYVLTFIQVQLKEQETYPWTQKMIDMTKMVLSCYCKTLQVILLNQAKIVIAACICQ